MVTTKKVLVLEFFDEDNKTYAITVNSPKDGLIKEDVVEAMNTIVDSDVFLTSGSKHLVDAANCYYKTTITEVLESNQETE